MSVGHLALSNIDLVLKKTKALPVDESEEVLTESDLEAGFQANMAGWISAFRKK